MPQVEMFRGQVVLVTGAGKGIGRWLARAFAAAGACVAANDVTEVNLVETVAQITAAGGTARMYLADQAKSFPVQAMLAQILEDWGRIDIVVVNAAVVPQAEILGMDEWDYQRSLEVNLAGPFWLLQAAGSAMQAAGSGTFLFVGADPGWVSRLRRAAAYRATQWGLWGLLQAAAAEFQAYNIRVHGLCLGPVTGALGTANPADVPRDWTHADDTAPDSMEQVAVQALFLCSPQASSLHGRIITAGSGREICLETKSLS